MHGMLAMVSSHVGVGITLLCGIRIWDVRDVRVVGLLKVLVAGLTILGAKGFHNLHLFNVVAYQP